MADGYDILRRLNYPDPVGDAVRRLLAEVMDAANGHDHDGTNSKGASLTGAGITASAEEIDRVCDGAGENATAANLNSLTGGGDIARAAGGHGHALAAGASDVTATAAEVNAVCDGHTLTVAGNIAAKRFVTKALVQGVPSAPAVIGVAPVAINSGAAGVVAGAGIRTVTADAPLSATDNIKSGTGGRATKHLASPSAIQSAIAGEATAFTQPGGATALEILQAADVEADRGRAIRIEGMVGGAEDYEDISLDAANTTTAVAGAKLFTSVSGVYTVDGNALGAQAVTVRASGGGATVCTLAGAASELGADIPADNQEAYCSEVTITGPNADASYVTVVGVDADTDAAARERVQLDGAAPSKATTTTKWRTVGRICLGEMTNAGAGSVATNDTVDPDSEKVGSALVAAAARGDDLVIHFAPNA